MHHLCWRPFDEVPSGPVDVGYLDLGVADKIRLSTIIDRRVLRWGRTSLVRRATVATVERYSSDGYLRCLRTVRKVYVIYRLSDPLPRRVYFILSCYVSSPRYTWDESRIEQDVGRFGIDVGYILDSRLKRINEPLPTITYLLRI